MGGGGPVRGGKRKANCEMSQGRSEISLLINGRTGHGEGESRVVHLHLIVSY